MRNYEIKIMKMTSNGDMVDAGQINIRAASYESAISSAHRLYPSTRYYLF